MAYPDSIKAACIAGYQAGLSTRQIEGVYDVDHVTVSMWVKGIDMSDPDAVFKKANAYAKDLSDKWESLAHLAVRQSATTIEKAGPYQAAMIGAVAVDKMRLLREQPTVIHRSTEEKRMALVQLLTGTPEHSPPDVEVIASVQETEGRGEAPNGT